ncbi:MAG: sugar ABC transporter substrate-binding protein [Gammaproteobacteria bacterium]|nr:MAG: sugar ABC transporter substrate-binding protein [Gammaproteobacteria bacterium]
MLHAFRWPALGAGLLLAACVGRGGPPPSVEAASPTEAAYRIGAGDTLQVFVWRNPEFSVTVPVRPDGRISIPLAEDIVAADKTPAELGREIETRLSAYIKNPVVTVIVVEFVGRPASQVRVIGEAARPQAVPYREGMTLLDVLIAVGGLTEFAAGNRATLVRQADGARQYRVRLDDLLNDGRIEANVELAPGDILIIPRSLF